MYSSMAASCKMSPKLAAWHQDMTSGSVSKLRQAVGSSRTPAVRVKAAAQDDCAGVSGAAGNSHYLTNFKFERIKRSLAAPTAALTQAILQAFSAASFVAFSHSRLWLCWLSDAVADWPATHPGQKLLQGNFAPVHQEVYCTNLYVEGSVPAGLEGTYMRTGPNPYFQPVAGYHWFDGDGMVHAVSLGGGKARSYTNHYVRTNRLQQDVSANRSVMIKVGDMYGLHGLLLMLVENLKYATVVNVAHGHGTANTSLQYHHGRILALHEQDMPYQVWLHEDGSLETLGRLDVGGNGSFTAHPKEDPHTGELFYFGYSMINSCFLTAGMLDAQGHITKQWKIHVPFKTLIHDCALTASYGIILHMPLVFDPKRMVTHNQLPLNFENGHPARIGLLRRDAPSGHAAVQWFDMPACYVLHVANAWEDPSSGLVHIVGCRTHNFDIQSLNCDAKCMKPDTERPTLCRFVLDPSTGSVDVIEVGQEHVEFPVVHPRKGAEENRYIWAMQLTTWLPPPHDLTACGIIKYDLGQPSCRNTGNQSNAVISYPDGCFSGEASFVPRPDSTEEDDGWLLTYVHNTITNESALHIYDAKIMDNTPLARVPMPQRVPFGFHGTFITTEQRQKQRCHGLKHISDDMLRPRATVHRAASVAQRLPVQDTEQTQHQQHVEMQAVEQMRR